MRFAFDIGFSSIGYAVDNNYKKFENNLPVWTGVWLFDNENYKSEINAVKREKRRKKRRKERLKRIRKLLDINLDENFKQNTKNIWNFIKKSKSSPLTKDEFNAVLYHFAKYRGYIDMRKTVKEDKEEGVIKKALKELNSLEGNNIFEKLLNYRKILIKKAVNNLLEKFDIDKSKSKNFLEHYMPYRNKNIAGLIKKLNETDLSTLFRTLFLNFLYYSQNVIFFVQIQPVTYNLNKNAIFYGYTKFQ